MTTRNLDVDEVGQEFEAPEVTDLGKATDVVQGGIISGWDHRGMSAPEFEFESDEEK